MSKKFNAKLRSQQWFDNPENPGMTALYIERSLNFGLTPEELRSGKPIIGIAQTGSDISPCNRVHIKLAERIREGIRSAGGIALEFPVHPPPGFLPLAVLPTGSPCHRPAYSRGARPARRERHHLGHGSDR